MQFWGKYRAEVMDVEDPEERGRVLVKCPSLLNDYELGWCEACLPPGVFLLPRKGDTVYIEFEQGNIQYPIWVGMLTTTKYVKETFFAESSYDPGMKMIVTEKHKIVLNDTDNNVRIETEGEMLLGQDDSAAPIARIGDAIEGTGADPQGGTVNITGVISDREGKIKSS